MRVIIQCVGCQKDVAITVDMDGYHMWKEGSSLIQDALPKNTPAEREMLVSNLCPECFKEMCSEDEVEFSSDDDLDDLAEENHQRWLEEDERQREERDRYDADDAL